MRKQRRRGGMTLVNFVGGPAPEFSFDSEAKRSKVRFAVTKWPYRGPISAERPVFVSKMRD